MIGLVHPIAQAGIELVVELIQSGNRSEVAVGSACVTHIAQAQRQSEVRVHLPRIAQVQRKAIVGTQSAAGKSEDGFSEEKPWPLPRVTLVTG